MRNAIDWEGVLNLIIAAIMGIGLCILFTRWESATILEVLELFTVLIAIFLYAILLQLGDIKRGMK